MNTDLSEKFREVLAFCDEGILLFVQRVKRMYPTLDGHEFLEVYKAELKKGKRDYLPDSLVDQKVLDKLDK